MFRTAAQYRQIKGPGFGMAQHRQLTTNGSPDASEFVDQDLTSIPDVGESASAVIGGDDALTSFTMYGSTPANMPRSNTVPGGSTHKPLSPSQSNGMEGLNGATLMEANRNKLDTIKAWSISTFKCTKQILSEKLGKGSKTVDVDLDAQIEALRDTQRKYTNILRLSRALTSHFYHVVQTQKALGETFAELAQKSPELQEEFSCNAETQRVLVRHGEGLLNALNFFTSSVNTLINKTMEDTLQTVKQYESARIEYDAYRTDLEALQLGVKNEPGYGAKLDEVARIYRQHLERFNQLRGDVNIKLKFLEENKVKVMHKQLLLFNRALTAYFSGNKDGLEQALKQFNINLKPPNTTPPSWLEAQ